MSDRVTITVQRPRVTINPGGAGATADLAAIEALTGTGLLRRTGSATWTLGTTVSLAEGGTGATTAAGARAALGLPLYAVQAADLVESSASATATDMSFTPEAASVYLVEAFLVYRSPATTTGFQWTFNASGYTWATQWIWTASNNFGSAQRLGTLTTIAGASVGSADQEYVTTGVAMLLTGAAPGDVSVTVQTEVNGSAITLKAGSHIRYTKIE